MAFLTANQIWNILIISLDTWVSDFNDANSTNIVVNRSFQPFQNSVDEPLAVYIFKINTKRYGFQGSSNVFNSGSGLLDHDEIYTLEETYQISSQAVSNTNVDAVRAIDIVESVSAYFQSVSTIQDFTDQGIGIFRITNIRQNHFVNDFNRYEPNPNFDFSITYRQQITTQNTGVTVIEGELIQG